MDSNESMQWIILQKPIKKILPLGKNCWRSVALIIKFNFSISVTIRPRSLVSMKVLESVSRFDLVRFVFTEQQLNTLACQKGKSTQCPMTERRTSSENNIASPVSSSTYCKCPVLQIRRQIDTT